MQIFWTEVTFHGYRNFVAVMDFTGEKYLFLTQTVITWNVTYLKIWPMIIFDKVQTFCQDVLSFHNAARLTVKV
jgi:hypothetical protein